MKTNQRSLLLALCLVVCAQFSLRAVPARPGVFTYTQPDGTVIRLQRHGDEFFSWTTFAGTDQVCALDADGFYRMSYLDKASMAEAGLRRQSENLGRIRPKGPQDDNVLTHGTRHIPVLLASFADVSFRIADPRAQFDALLNEKGYSANGGTGSVQDFYNDNSKGKFTPIFDVFGPVTLSREMAYYGENSGNSHAAHAKEAVAEAAQLLDDVIDFSQYDYDKDGYVDMVLFYYAGYNEAEGGPEESIWPHKSSLGGNYSFDGKKMGTYFCTSELRGYKGVNMCGIGTTCHEFGHSLGLPDFYDTDYELNGQSDGLFLFSTMCSGCYNNDGCTPPYFNAEERVILGWMADSDIKTLEKGTISFGSIKDDIAYRSYTDTEGEYFLYECRDGSGWDRPIRQFSGLIVYHVDKSKVRRVGGLTPYEQWNQWTLYNAINAYGDHPCFHVVVAADQENLNYTATSGWSFEKIAFPGAANITTYTPVDWEGNYTKDVLSGISYANGKITLTFDSTNHQKVLGKVYGQDDVPVQGVSVVAVKPMAGRLELQKVLPHAQLFKAVTDSKGAFTLDLDGFEGETVHLSFFKDGYYPSGMDVTLSPRATRGDAVIKKKGEGDPIEYWYYDPSASRAIFGAGPKADPKDVYSYMGAIRIKSSELPANGGRLTKVSFPTLWTAEAYYVVVDSGDERLLFSEISGLGPSARLGQMVDVNLSSLNVNFKADQDLYVGIAVENAQPYSGYEGYIFYITYNTQNCFSSPFNKTSSNWHSNGYAMVLTATVIPKEWPLADMGFNAIADPGQGNYSSGYAFALDVILARGNRLKSDISWTMDGAAIAAGAASVSLTSGRHTITASYTLTDGTGETLELMVNVQ